MKNVAFAAQVFSLLGMLPVIALLYFNHASHDPNPDRSTRIKTWQTNNAANLVPHIFIKVRSLQSQPKSGSDNDWTE
ncbi:MAG TPA: hypothetical protein VK618_06220 [Flavitalea sp.]|nr:hypothetical protein [Flavitalea sp.]